MKRIRRFLALLLVGVIGLSGCGNKGASTQNGKKDSKGLQKVVIGAGNTSVSSATEVIAYYAGIFEEEGLDVEIILLMPC